MGRLEKLRQLERELRTALDEADPRSIASIARQYRETIREIEEIEGATDDGDEIAQILSDVDADGNARAVR